MEITLSAPIGVMAVIIDTENRVSEVVDVDRISILSIVLNSVAGVAQFALGFGGVDSSGQFHLDKSRAEEATHITITRKDQPEQFDTLFMENGSLKTSFPEEFFADLCPTLIAGAHKQLWGADYPAMEATVVAADKMTRVSAGAIASIDSIKPIS